MSRGMRQYNEHNDLMQLATPEDAPAPEEFDPFQHTNEVNPMDYAEDNNPNRLEFAKGGVVPNPGGMRRGPSGSTDTVPAMLTPEEYVVPRDVVLKKGTDFFDKIRDQARGMGQKGKEGAGPAPGPQAVPGPQGETRAGYSGGGVVDWLKKAFPVDDPKQLVSGGQMGMVNNGIDAVKSGANALSSGMRRIVDQRNYGMPDATPDVKPTAPQPSQFPDYDKTMAVQTDIKANPAKYPQPENAWGFDPAKRFIETPIGGGMTRKTMTPEYSKYLDQGGKPLQTEDNASVPAGMKLEGIPAGMSREQFAQNKNFDQYMTYAEKEQALAGKAADADYARQRANIVTEDTYGVTPLGEGAYATIKNTSKHVPGLISTATVKPNDFTTQQNLMANNTMDNMTQLQKEALQEQREAAKASTEEVKKSFAGLDGVILGGWNKTKGEVVPGMAEDEPEQAANYFKSALASTGVPSSFFDGVSVIMPQEGSNIMAIYDPAKKQQLSGTPKELATKIYEIYNGNK